MSEVTIRGELAQKLMLLAQIHDRSIEDSVAVLVEHPFFWPQDSAVESLFRLVQNEQQLHELESVNQHLVAEVERLCQVVKELSERSLIQQQSFDLALEKERAHILAQFIADTSHEFRNSLALINTQAYLLANTNDCLRREVYYRRIGRATQHINGLVDAMLEAVELENQPTLTLQSFNLNELIQGIVAEMRGRFDAKKQTLTLVLADQPLMVRADSKRLRRALFHIIDNAHKFTEDGGTITITTVSTASGVSIGVSDTGKGIRKEVQPHIFERFYRDDPARTVRGFGLGLTIAQKVIDYHHGTIEVQSEVGQGSRFTIVLPC